MKRQAFILTVLVLTKIICYGQKDTMYTYIAHATLNNNLKNHLLIDTTTGTKFLLDSMQVFITAIDKNGKQLWRTDPWKDNGLIEYRVKRPIIVIFYFANNKWTNNETVIWITYNNTQFGVIDKKTGMFKFFGQD